MSEGLSRVATAPGLMSGRSPMHGSLRMAELLPRDQDAPTITRPDTQMPVAVAKKSPTTASCQITLS